MSAGIGKDLFLDTVYAIERNQKILMFFWPSVRNFNVTDTCNHPLNRTIIASFPGLTLV